MPLPPDDTHSGSEPSPPEQPPTPPVNSRQKGTSRLIKSSLVVSTMTMTSRILGLVRDMVFARFLGADAAADAFYMAFRIPNFFRRLFAEGAFAQAFVPVLSEYRTKGSRAAIQELINRVAGCLGSALLVVTILAAIGSPVVTLLFAPGYFFDDKIKFWLTSDMLRITFPYLALISLTGFAGAVLNSFGRFAIPAFTPVLLNVCLIFAAIVMMPWFDPPALGLAWGVLMAGVVQFVFQMPFLMRLRVLPRPKLDWHHEGVKKILLLMLPALFGVSVSQVNLLLDSVIASFLGDGPVSWLYYSDRLTELPLGVFAIAIATVITPTLSRQHASANTESFAITLDWAVRLIFLVALPATFALLILAEPILLTLFEGKKFDLNAVSNSSYSLRAYSVGLLAFMLIKVLAPGFFAKQDMKTPVKIGIVAMVSNMLLNILFVVPLYYFYDLGHMGLALATSVAAFINAGLLFRGLKRRGVFVAQAGWLTLGVQLLAANTAMVVVLLLLSDRLALWIGWNLLQRSMALALLVGAGMSAYLLVLFLTGMRWSHLRTPIAESP